MSTQKPQALSVHSSGMCYRKDPFPEWVEEYLNTEESTFLELMSSNTLYTYVSANVLNHVSQSFRGEMIRYPKTRETKLMEQLAKERMMKQQQQDESETKSSSTELDHSQEEEKRCALSLGLGLHNFEFNGHQMWAFHHTSGDPVATRAGPIMFTSLIILVEGRDNRIVLEEFCEACTEPKVSKRTSPLFFKIYRWSNDCGRWNNGGRRLRRELETIVLPKVDKDRIVSDMERFLDEKTLRWYFSHGIPYRRSYLFYGLPGSGKSSLIQALAGRFSRNLCFLQPTHPKMTDEVFKSCIEMAPAPSLIVLEDIDALFGKDRSKKHPNCPLTFSGLLNGLDGVGGLDGQIFVMTTNFVDQLDDALIRSGRVDLYLEFKLALDEQILKMFELFYPDEAQDSELSDEFLAQCRRVFPEGISMAALQQHFIQQIFKPARVAIDTLPTLGDRLDVVTQFDARFVEPDADVDVEDKKNEDSENMVDVN